MRLACESIRWFAWLHEMITPAKIRAPPLTGLVGSRRFGSAQRLKHIPKRDADGDKNSPAKRRK
jgi:hypothetical protein